jgi:DNA replicative helicase MCM subunit Mcm2 (Cdc46/Mcm family)
MKKKHKKEPERAIAETKTVNINELKPGLVFDVKREGIFVHSFECKRCGLHFNVFSWQINRHRVENTYCPECGKQGAFLHYRCVLSEDPNFDITSLQEIYHYVPFPGSQVMDDSVVPGILKPGDQIGKANLPDHPTE